MSLRGGNVQRRRVIWMNSWTDRREAPVGAEAPNLEQNSSENANDTSDTTGTIQDGDGQPSVQNSDEGEQDSQPEGTGDAEQSDAGDSEEQDAE